MECTGGTLNTAGATPARGPVGHDVIGAAFGTRWNHLDFTLVAHDLNLRSYRAGLPGLNGLRRSAAVSKKLTSQRIQRSLIENRPSRQTL